MQRTSVNRFVQRQSAFVAVLLLLTVAGVTGCDSGTSEPIDGSDTPLDLEWVEAFRKTGHGPPLKSGLSTIDLGSIGFGRDYFFMVTNNSDRPVHDVRIELSADSAFSLTPATLSVVPPGVDASVMPLIRLSIVHGRSPEGLGPFPLLAPGTHSAVIRLEGDVESVGDSTRRTVALEKVITVNALVSSVEFFDRDGPIDLRDRDGVRYAAGFESPGPVSYYIKSGRVDVVNTGNARVGIRYFPESLIDIPDEVDLLPGDSLFVPADSAGYIRFAPRNALSDPVALPLKESGYGYYFFRNEDDG